MNVEQKILALESLLEKVRTNAAKPRPARGAAIATSQPTTAATRATDDVAGPAVAAPPARVAPVAAPGTTKFADDDWSDTTEQFETPIPLAAPIPGPAKDAGTKTAPATATPKPGPAKPATPVVAAKPAEPALAKPALATPAVAPVKPVVAPPTINKPAVTPPVVKPVLATPNAKPTPPPNAPISLTKQVAAPVIKTPTAPVTPPVAKPLEAGLNKTLTGVGDGAVKAPDIRAGAIAAGIALPITGDPPPVEPVVELEKKPLPIKTERDRMPSLPSVIADSDGEEDAEPTQLYEPSAASRRAAELAAMDDKQLEDVKRSLGVDKKGDADQIEIRLPDTQGTPDKIEVRLDGPKLDLPWVEKTERKIEPDTIGLPIPEDKLPKKPGPSRTELDLELVASQEGDLEAVDLDVADAKIETKPLAPAVSDDKPSTSDAAPISEKKPIVETKPAVEKKPVVESRRVEDEPVLEKPSAPSRGVPKLLIVVAAILLVAAGAFVAMKQGWLGGAGPMPTPTQTVAPPTNPTPTVTQTAKPTPTQTAQQPATNDTAVPAASASAAPADSAAAPADSAAAAPADSAAAAPPASASAAAEPPAPPATAGSPSVDPATLNNNQGLIFVTSNKPARVYLTGKLAGDTNAELKVDCGLKFVRLADPAQDIAKPPMWLTAGEPKQIDCRKYTTFTLNVP